VQTRTQRVRDHPHDHAFVVEDEADLLFSGASPNPDRVGCPPRDVISELARRQRSIDDPLWVHLAHCSECFVEVRAQQQSAESPHRRGGPVVRWVMVAATIILVTGGSIWLFDQSGESQTGQQGTTTSLTAGATGSIEIDLRDRAIERGDQNTGAAQPLLLPRSRINLTVLLPFGSEPGLYELELIGADGDSRTSAAGSATVREFVTTLQVVIDLSALPPGPSQFGLRHQSDGWRFFPVTLS
jgi:hypothetical protein